MHCPEAVDGLIAKLTSSTDRTTRRLAFKALCRLDHREADYTGDWWTTRPDTSGPYYKPVAWDQTKKIERALGDALKRADSHTAGELLVELVRNKVELEGAGAVDIDLAALEPSARAVVVDILVARRSLPERASRFLEELALSDKESPALRAKVLTGLIRHQPRSAIRLLAAIGQQDKLPAAVLDVWRDYLRDDSHARRVGEFRRLAKDKTIRRCASWDIAVLLALEVDPKTPARAKSEAERAIESAWNTPRETASLLRAIGRTDAMNYAFQVRNHLKDEHREVKEAAAFAAARLDLDHETAGASRGPTIASMPFESVLARGHGGERRRETRRAAVPATGVYRLPHGCPGPGPEGSVIAWHRRPIQARGADRIDLEAKRQDCTGLRAAKDRHRRRPDVRGFCRPRVGQRNRAARRRRAD